MIFSSTIFKNIIQNPPSPEWLIWFIGFSEGDGCFMVTKRGDLMFVITLIIIDIELLHMLKNQLHFGTVYVQGINKTNARFIRYEKYKFDYSNISFEYDSTI